MCDLGGMQEFRRVASGRCWPGRKPANQTAGQPAGQLASEQAGPRCPRWHQVKSIFFVLLVILENAACIESSA